MSRMTTSRANLSWAMPAMRRACSSGVRAGMLAAVQRKLRDQLRNGGRHQAVDRLSTRDAFPHLARGNRPGADLEEQHAFRPLELLEHGVEPFARIAGSGRNREARELEHGLRFFPAGELAELVRADQEQRIPPPKSAQ